MFEEIKNHQESAFSVKKQSYVDDFNAKKEQQSSQYFAEIRRNQDKYGQDVDSAIYRDQIDRVNQDHKNKIALLEKEWEESQSAFEKEWELIQEESADFKALQEESLFIEKRKTRHTLEETFAAKPSLKSSFKEADKILLQLEGLSQLSKDGKLSALNDSIVFDEDEIPVELINKEIAKLENEKYATEEWKKIENTHSEEEVKKLKETLHYVLRISAAKHYLGDQEISLSVDLGVTFDAFDAITSRVVAEIKRQREENEAAKNELENSVVADEMHQVISEGRVDSSVENLLKNNDVDFTLQGRDQLKSLPEKEQMRLYKQACTLKNKSFDAELSGDELTDALLVTVSEVEEEFQEKMSGVAWEQGLIGSAMYMQGIFGGRNAGEKALYEDVGFGFDSMKITDTQGTVMNTIDFQGTEISYRLLPDGTMILFNELGEESDRIPGLSPAEIKNMIADETIRTEEMLDHKTWESMETGFSQRWAERITKHVQGNMTAITVGREKVFDAVHAQTFGSHLDAVLKKDTKRGYLESTDKGIERDLFVEMIYKENAVGGHGFSIANKVLSSNEFKRFVQELPDSISVWDFLKDAGLVGTDSIALESGGPFFKMGRNRLRGLVGSVNETQSIQFGDLADFVETGNGDDAFAQKYGKYFGMEEDGMLA